MSVQRLFVIAACVLVAAAAILSLVTIGTPGRARLAALDRRRAGDLDAIATSVHERYATSGDRLPKRLPSDITNAHVDPESHRPYEYRMVDKRHYRLCAVFSLPDEIDRTGEPAQEDDWVHPAGRTCYAIDVLTSPPVPQLATAGSR